MAMFLLVDDAALVIRCYERLLAETTTTHRVVSARDDSCARQVILDMAERRDLIDVALLDLHLEHGHEGTELIPLLRRLHGGVVVAVMSAYLESSTAYTIQQHFRALAIPKPLSPDLLEALAHDPFGQSRDAISGFARAHGLSPREQQVVAAEVAGWDMSTVATRLGVKEATIDTHWQHVFRKCGLRSRREVMAALVRHILQIA